MEPLEDMRHYVNDDGSLSVELLEWVVELVAKVADLEARIEALEA